MVFEDFRPGGSDEGHLSGLQSSFGAWLSRHSKLSNARTAVMAVHNGEQKTVFEKALFLTKLRLTFFNDSTELFGGKTDHSTKPSTVLVLVCL